MMKIRRLARRYHPRYSHTSFLVCSSILGIVALFAPRPSHVYSADPGTILISLAISAAVSAASYGVDYLLASKQKGGKVDRGKIDDIRLSTSEYGASVIKGWGKFRCAPNWIWHSAVVDTVTTTPGHNGGKGAPKPPTPTVTDHVYSTTLAGLLCEGPISSVRKIWFDTDIVANFVATSFGTYQAESGSNTRTGTAAVLSNSAAYGGQVVTGVSSTGTLRFNGITASSGAGSYEIGVGYFSSVDSTVSYSVNGGGTSTLLFPASGGTSTESYHVFTVTLSVGSSNFITFSNATGVGVDIDYIQVTTALDISTGIDPRDFTGLINPIAGYSQNRDAAWPAYNYIPTASATGSYSANLAKYGQPSIRIYTGTETQTADSAIIAAKGIASAPAYRGYAYIVIENLQLVNGRVPNVTVEVDQGTTALDQVVQDHYTAVGRLASDLDLSALSGDTVTGWLLSSREQAGQSVVDLQTAYQFDLPEVDGKVYAIKRNGTSAITIPYADLRAHNFSDQMPPADATITDVDPTLLPARVDVNYLDPELDYHNNTQSDMDITGSGAQDNVTVSLPWITDKNTAKKLAVTLRNKPYLEGRTFEFSTTVKYLKLYPGLVVTLTLPNATHVVRITEMTSDLPPGVVNFKAVRQQASLYSPSANGSVSSGIEAPVVAFPGNARGVIIDGPVVRAEDLGDGTHPNLYVAMCGRGDGAYPGGFFDMEKPAGSGTYELLTTFTQACSIGQSVGTLASVTNPDVWDRTSTLTIDFYGNTILSSASETDLLQHPEINLLWVGSAGAGEYVQFKNAVASTPASGFQKRWIVDTFLRARFLTGDMVGTHTATDDVVLMDSTVKPRRLDISDVGKSPNYKFITSGQSTADAATVTQAVVGRSLLPPAVANITGVRNDVGDLLVSWVRVARFANGLRDSAGVAQLTEEEIYQFEAYSGSTLKRGPIRLKRPIARVPMWRLASKGGSVGYDLDTNGTFTYGTVADGDAGTIVVHESEQFLGDLFFEWTVSGWAGGGKQPKMGIAPKSLALADRQVFTPSWYINGVTTTSITAEGLQTATVAIGDRIAIRIRGGVVDYFKNYISETSVPFYRSKVEFPSTVMSKIVLYADGIDVFGVDTTRIISALNSYVYTAADQTADFGSVQSSVKVRVYQESPLIGRGPYKEATI